MRALGGACLVLCFGLVGVAPAAPAPLKPSSTGHFVVLDTSLARSP